MSPAPARRRRPAPLITFLSDYGYSDEFVGVCHGVIARRCPSARVIDITHGIPRHDISAGALALRAALPYTPAGVHLAVVDPGVGGERRAIALITRQESRLLVGPDNGLLLAAAALFGGALEAIEISTSNEALNPVSPTFHGRDIFAPVAAALADGVPLARLGEPIAPESLVALARPRKTRRRAASVLPSESVSAGEAAEQPPAVERSSTLVTRVLSIDGYGNVSLNAAGPAFAEQTQPPTHVVIEVGAEHTEAIVGQTFGDVPAGQLVAYVDSRGSLALAVNGGSAAEQLALQPHDVLKLRFR